jgi:mannose-1-phosphate guanylyltransferase/mannose-6-phosphate isomerase
MTTKPELTIVMGFSSPLVVTGADYRFVVSEQLEAERIKPLCFIVEPEARNTTPAVLAAALSMAEEDPESLLLVMPSDHAIADHKAFRRTVQRGENAAREGRIVTFGIRPTRLETGYGWLEAGEAAGFVAPLNRHSPTGMLADLKVA